MGKRVGLLAGLLVLTLGSGAVAQEASPGPPPWLGGRVEMPGYGFAVTLPDDWVAFDTSADAVVQREAVADVLDPDVWSTDDAVWIDGFAELVSDDVPLWSAHATSTNRCVLGGSDRSSFAEVANYYLEWYLDDPDMRDVEPRLIDVPTGTAYRIRMTYRDGPDSDEWWPMSTYLLDGDGVVFDVSCWSYDARPDDDWLGIVETFEFLPVEETAPIDG